MPFLRDERPQRHSRYRAKPRRVRFRHGPTRRNSTANVAYEVDVSTPAGAAGSEIGGCSAATLGSTDDGGGAMGADFRGFAVFFFAVFLTASLGLGGDFAFLLGGFVALFATFFALPADFAGLFFFFVVLLLAAVYLAFPTDRFLVLLFFLAMVSFLLAVLRLLIMRVALKKSAVICV
jgi:hypothetical protein